MPENILKEILEDIDTLLDLGPKEIDKGKKIAENINEISNKIKSLITKTELKNNYLKKHALVNKYSSKLSEDLFRSKNSNLETEWNQIAEKDLEKLKDNVIPLKKFIKEHEDYLMKNIFTGPSEIGIKELIVQLEEINSLDPMILQKLSRLVDNMSENSLKKKSKQLKKRIDRMSDFILMLKEVENVGT